MQTTTINQFEYREGDKIMLLEPIQNGIIEIQPLAEGTITKADNQEEATVWFSCEHFAGDIVKHALKLDTSSSENGFFDGVAIKLKRNHFALTHVALTLDFSKDIIVEEETALTIPFFTINEKNRSVANWRRFMGEGIYNNVYQYSLAKVIEEVNSGFIKWVHTITEMIRVSDIEKENGDYPFFWETRLTDKSNKLYKAKKREVELAFAKSTGVYREFTGGLLNDRQRNKAGSC